MLGSFSDNIGAFDGVSVVRNALREDVSKKVDSSNPVERGRRGLYVPKPSKVHQCYFDFVCDISVWLAGVMIYAPLQVLGFYTTKK